MCCDKVRCRSRREEQAFNRVGEVQVAQTEVKDLGTPEDELSMMKLNG